MVHGELWHVRSSWEGFPSGSHQWAGTHLCTALGFAAFFKTKQNELETERQILPVLQSTEPCVDQPHHHHASGEFLFEVGPVRQESSTLMQQTTAGCSPKNQQKTNSVSRNDDSKFCWFSAMTPSLPIQQWFVSVVNHQKKNCWIGSERKWKGVQAVLLLVCLKLQGKQLHQLPSLKLTFSPLRIGRLDLLVSFWGV